MKLYGIKNCDTVKKARKWLEEQGIAYAFHDYKKDGVDEAVLRAAVEQHGWEVVLNKRGTTWRKLTDEVKDSVVDDATAMAAMIDNPSLIKRPIVKAGERLIIGFDTESYNDFL